MKTAMSATDKQTRNGWTAIEELRLLVSNFNRCSSDFLNRFTIEELIKLHHAHQACDWDFYPDQWEERQVQEALAGKPPKWNPETEEAVYE